MSIGLTSLKAQEILLNVGRNEISVKRKFSTVSLFFFQFPTVINGVLFLAALLSFFIADLIDGLLIIFILVLNALFGFIQEYKAEKSLEKLKSFITPLSRVIRDGKETQIPTPEIVPGDIVILSEGDRIPADGTLSHSFHLEVDESILSGESLPVIKNAQDKLLSGTLIMKGKGLLCISQTGINTRFGQIAQTLESLKEETSPLTNNLNSLGKTLSLASIGIALLIIPIGLLYGRPIISLILLSISIAIAAIPEGLPAVITIALAIGSNRMAKKNAIIRKMPAIETLGSVQVILLDKTGTLTQNSMSVKNYWLFNKDYFGKLLSACVLGNTASLISKEDGGSSYDIVGDKTDGALLVFAKHYKFKKPEAKVIDEYVFDPKTKTVTTLVEYENKKHVFVRGAAEAILNNSNLSQKEKLKINSELETYAKEGLRVIAFGYGNNPKSHTNRTELEQNLEFLGFVTIYDPLRPEAKKTIEQAKKAGIHIVMVTGDNKLTAEKIAFQAGLLQKGEDIITGEELAKLTDNELKTILPHIRIFARTEPQDKLRLVELFQSSGFIVGVSGDGVNDALALKKADVGVAMGKKGTDVAKEASDIILSDDNFATLVKAIEEGRIIFNNIIKSVTYLLSGNLAEISLVLFASFLGLPTPLLPTQILWINVVTDGLPALALASDTKDIGILSKKPRHPKEQILNSNRLLFIVSVGMVLSLSLLILFMFLLNTTSERFARTVTFNMLIILHLVLAFVVRDGSGFTGNKFLNFSVIATILIQLLITTLPFFQTLFHLGF